VDEEPMVLMPSFGVMAACCFGLQWLVPFLLVHWRDSGIPLSLSLSKHDAHMVDISPDKETNLYGFVAIIATELITSSIASMSPLNCVLFQS